MDKKERLLFLSLNGVCVSCEVYFIFFCKERKNSSCIFLKSKNETQMTSEMTLVRVAIVEKYPKNRKTYDMRDQNKICSASAAWSLLTFRIPPKCKKLKFYSMIPTVVGSGSTAMHDEKLNFFG